MTATGDTIAAIQALIQQLQHAATATRAAGNQADQGRAIADRLGNTQNVAGFAQVQHLLGQAHQAIGAAVQHAENAINRTKSIEGGL